LRTKKVVGAYSPLERTLRYSIAAPENRAVRSFAISPDGTLLAIAAAVNGKQQLWLRPLDASGAADARYGRRHVPLLVTR
jgi:hypothetical protein